MHKPVPERSSPLPGRTYPAVSVKEMPGAVQRLRTAMRTRIPGSLPLRVSRHQGPAGKSEAVHPAPGASPTSLVVTSMAHTPAFPR